MKNKYFVDDKREWHDCKSKSHLLGKCDPMYRKCKHCGDAHPVYILRCPMENKNGK